MANQDKVVLSPLAREIHEAAKTLSAVPDVCEEKVAAIRSQIENGTYQIDGQKIAGRMLEDVLCHDLNDDGI